MRKLTLSILALLALCTGAQAETVKTQVDLSAMTEVFNFGGTASYDADTKTISFQLVGDALNLGFGLKGLDYVISDYDRLVVKLGQVAVDGWHTPKVRVDDAQGGNYQTEDVATDKTITIDLTDGSLDTNNDNDGTPRTMTTIHEIYFWTMFSPATVTVKEIYLEKDGEKVPSGDNTLDLSQMQVFYNFGQTADLDAATATVTCVDCNTCFGLRGLDYNVADYQEVNVTLTFIGERPWYVRACIDNGDEPRAELEPSQAIGEQQTLTFDLTDGLTANQEGKDAVAIEKMSRIYIFTMGTGNIQVNKVELVKKDITTGIDESVKAAAYGKTAVYDLSGRPTQQLRHGLNIVHRADGTTVKVVK